MKKKSLLLLIFIVVFLLAACNQQEQIEFNTEPLTVEFETDPAQDLQSGQPVEMTVVVYQGDELVDDASDVQFEIWPEGQDDHEFIPAENKGEGRYSITRTFEEPGLYYVMYHVTARDYHNMERMELNIK
ncbi:MAG: FixH family protein [Bacillaceae bacterium]|nr:FixH family protein [Bacillaceae bacterium]